jgi:hypothetical protein
MSLIKRHQQTLLSDASSHEEDYMKIEIVRQQKSKEQTTFLVTRRGMVGSLRTPKSNSEDDVHGDIMIGRQAITEDGVRPNDITLSISDLAISRTHCRIIY